MGITERAVHIKNLIALKDFCNNNGVFTLASNIEQSLDYAISSLKTDEAYQIMYEGGEIFTKADMIDMLTELKTKIDMMSDSVVEGRTVTITSWRGMQKRICKLIQSRIDELKEQEDGSDN